MGSERRGNMAAAATPHAVRVCRLYRGAIRCIKDWSVNRFDILEVELPKLRAQFDANKELANAAMAESLVLAGERRLTEMTHPDPYIRPERPGGTKWQRNVPPP